MELQPQFLFNTLNSIAELIGQNPTRAESMTVSLRELLRMTLDLADRREVSLGDELKFVNSYLGIVQSRFGNRFIVNSDIQPGLLDIMVPPMVVQPIVENAVEHGVERNLGDSVLVISAWRDNTGIRILVQDNGPGFAEWIQEGIGLQSIRTRLQQFYGSEEWILCETLPSGGAQVSLVLPYRFTQLSQV